LIVFGRELSYFIVSRRNKKIQKYITQQIGLPLWWCSVSMTYL